MSSYPAAYMQPKQLCIAHDSSRRDKLTGSSMSNLAAGRKLKRTSGVLIHAPGRVVFGSAAHGLQSVTVYSPGSALESVFQLNMLESLQTSAYPASSTGHRSEWGHCRAVQAARRDEFDRIVIETTGLASPAPIIQTFFMEPQCDSQAAPLRLYDMTYHKCAYLALADMGVVYMARYGRCR